MEALNLVLSRVLIAEKKLAMQKLQGYSRALELNNRQREAVTVDRIKIELKKIQGWQEQ